MTAGLELFGGAVDGTLISTANSSISFTSGGTADFDTGQTFKTGTSLRIPSGSIASYVRWDGLAGTTNISVSFYCRFASVNPSAASSTIAIRDNAGANLAGLVIRTNGRLAAINAAGAVITANGGTDIAAHLLTANNWYRVDLLVTIGTSTTGRVQYRIIDVQSGDNDTPITTPYDSGASQNLGTTSIDRLYLGSIGAVTMNGDYNYGIVRWDTGSTTYFDQYTDAIRSVNSQQGTSLSAAANLLLPEGAASGDLVMYLISCDNTGGTAISAAGGSGGGSAWTDISSSVITGNVLEGRVFARVLTGTTGDNICNPNGAAQDYTAIGVCIFGTKHPYTSSTNLATALADAIANSASNSAADPPNANPGTSATYTWLTWATIDKGAGSDSITVAPSGYTSVGRADSALGSTTSTFARLAYRRLSASSEDPGTFTNTARPWIAYTVAIAAFVEITVPTATLALTPVAPSISETSSALALLTPADDTFEDLTDGVTFTWDHPGTQTTYAFRRRRVSSGPWEYWNGSGWQSTVTFISSATEAVTFSAGQW